MEINIKNEYLDVNYWTLNFEYFSFTMVDNDEEYSNSSCLWTSWTLNIISGWPWNRKQVGFIKSLMYLNYLPIYLSITHIHTNNYDTYIYIYIYICVCVCVCVWWEVRRCTTAVLLGAAYRFFLSITHIHTNNYDTYIYMCVYVCVCWEVRGCTTAVLLGAASRSFFQIIQNIFV